MSIACSNILFTTTPTLGFLCNTRALLGSWWKLTTADSVQALFAESTAVVVWKKNGVSSVFYQGFTKGFQMDAVFLTRCHQISVFVHVFCPSDLFKNWEVKFFELDFFFASGAISLNFGTFSNRWIRGLVEVYQWHTNLGLANCHCPPWHLRFKE